MKTNLTPAMRPRSHGDGERVASLGIPRGPLAAALIVGLLSSCVDQPVGPPSRGEPIAPSPRAAFDETVTDEYFTDWSEYASDAQPSGWSQMWDPSPYFAVTDDSTATGGKVLNWSATSISRNRFAFGYEGLGQPSNQEVYTEFRVRALGGGSSVFYMGAAAVRLAGTAADERGYAVYFVTTADMSARSIVLSTFQSGAYVQLGQDNTQWNLDEWYSIRLRAVGDSIHAKVWPRTGSEPTNWSISVRDTRYAAGAPGVSQHDNGHVQWDVWGAKIFASSAVNSIELLPASTTTSTGSTIQFTVTAHLDDGTSRPIAADFAATGGSISSTGLFTAGSTTGSFSVIATEPISGLADTAAVTLIAPEPGGTYATGFRDALGQPPAGWTETSAPQNSDWTIEVDQTVGDRAVLRNVSTATARHILRLDWVADTASTQEVLTKLRMSDADDRGPGIALRHTMGSAESAYVAYLRPGVDLLEVNSFINGAWGYVGAASFSNAPGVWYWMRFRAEGTSLRVRVWPDGEPEPAAWLFTAGHGTLTRGSAGLYTYEPNTVDFDGASVALGGGTAPLPPTLSEIVLSPPSATIPVDSILQFGWVGITSDGGSIPLPVSLTASGGTVDSTGLYTAPGSAGTYQVYATDMVSGLTDSSTVTVVVRPRLVSIELSPDSLELSPGDSALFTVAGQMSDGSTVPVSVQFSADAGDISSLGRYVAPDSGGVFRVIAMDTLSGLADTSHVTVSSPVTLGAVELSPDTVEVLSGGTTQFTVVGTMTDGSTVPVAVDFTTNGGTISPTGLYTAPASGGPFRVVATEPVTGLADTSVVSIRPLPTLSHIELTPDSVSLLTGGSVQFTVVGRMTDGTTKAVAALFATTGGKINKNGLYTAPSTAGVYRVIARDPASGMRDTSYVSVQARPTLVSLEMTPSSVSLLAQRTAQFTVIGTMSDGTSGPVTVAFSTTGGRITSTGLYTAPNSAGTFSVLATHRQSGLSVSSAVTVSCPSGTPITGRCR